VWPPAAAEINGELHRATLLYSLTQFPFLAAQSSSPFMCFAVVKGLAAIVGPFIAASLHPSRIGVPLRSSSSGWAGFGFTGTFNFGIYMLMTLLLTLYPTAITIFVGSMMLATAALAVLSLGLRMRSKMIH
jgi:hypothetical protein